MRHPDPAVTAVGPKGIPSAAQVRHPCSGHQPRPQPTERVWQFSISADYTVGQRGARTFVLLAKEPLEQGEDVLARSGVGRDCETSKHGNETHFMCVRVSLCVPQSKQKSRLYEIGGPVGGHGHDYNPYDGTIRLMTG